MEMDNKRLSLIRNYPLETLIASMCGAIFFLTGWIYVLDQKLDKTNTEIKSYYLQDTKVLIQALDRNTQAMNNFQNFTQNK